MKTFTFTSSTSAIIAFMTLQLARNLRNSLLFSWSRSALGRKCGAGQAGDRRVYRYLCEGPGRRARGTRGATGPRVYSVTRSLRYLSVARPTFSILKEKVTMPENKQFQRLPKNVVPKHYDLELVPDLGTFSFKGKTAVKVSVRGASLPFRDLSSARE